MDQHPEHQRVYGKVLFLFLLLPLFSAGQWESAVVISAEPSTLDDPYPMSPSGALFATPSHGIHTRSRFLSPSSGSISSIHVTDDTGVTWSEFGSHGGMGTGLLIVGAERVSGIYFIAYFSQGTFNYVKYIPGVGAQNMFTSSGPVWFAPVDSSLIYFTQYVEGNTYLSRYESGIYHMRYDTLEGFNATHTTFINASTGFMAATPAGSSVYDRIFTTDGEGIWSMIFNTTDVPIRKIGFTSPTNGYVLCDTTIMHRTTDGGLTWTEVLNTDVLLRQMFFINDTVGVVAGANGTVLRTMDGGATWSQDQFPSTEEVDRIYIFEDHTAYAHVGNIRIYRSTIGSGTWGSLPEVWVNVQPNPSAGAFHITSSFFISELEVFDGAGRLLLRKEVGGMEYDLDLQGWSAGLFQLRVIGADGTQRSVRVLKEG